MPPENEKRFKERMGYKVNEVERVNFHTKIDVNLFLSKILGWSQVYHGFDGRPWKIVGIVKYDAGMALIFEHTVCGKQVCSLQILSHEQLEEIGEWFFKRRTRIADPNELASIGFYF